MRYVYVYFETFYSQKDSLVLFKIKAMKAAEPFSREERELMQREVVNYIHKRKRLRRKGARVWY